VAHVAGADFVSAPDFDATRAFIRHGQRAGHPLVVRRAKPILADDTLTMRQTNGHLLTVNWTRDGRHIVGQLSLFDGPTYSVSLATNYSSIWLPLRSGGAFPWRAPTAASVPSGSVDQPTQGPPRLRRRPPHQFSPARRALTL
jgi:hypothetical protein